MRTLVLGILISLPFASLAAGQIGGTGTDGPFAPTQSGTLDTDRGPWMFSRITIPFGVTIRLIGTAPALLLSTGDVSIEGNLIADGQTAPTPEQAGLGGPGGYPGGRQSNGLGPGGGGVGGGGCGGIFPCFLGSGGGGGHAIPGATATSAFFPGAGGQAYGTAYPFEPQGGSGGGSSIFDARATQFRHAGSGGGGAVLLLADGEIRVRGAVTARGGDAASVPWGSSIVGGGAGAGGSVLIRSARGVVVTGGIDARGGIGQAGGGGAGSHGFVRIESYGTAPVLGSGIAPPPSSAELPALRQTASPRRGATWRLTAVAMPTDAVFLFVSLAPANIPLPPLGILRLEPNLTLLAGVATCQVSHDPIAFFDLPIPDDAGVVGITLHAQGINPTTPLVQSRLTGSIAGTIQ